MLRSCGLCPPGSTAIVGINAPGSDAAAGAACAAVFTDQRAPTYPITTEAVLALSPSMIACTTTGCLSAPGVVPEARRDRQHRSHPALIDRPIDLAIGIHVADELK